MVELGSTRLSSLDERETEETQRAVCAYGADAGRYLTEITRVYWLRQPVPMRGKPGLWQVTLPVNAIPEEVQQRLAPARCQGPSQAPRERANGECF